MNVTLKILLGIKEILYFRIFLAKEIINVLVVIILLWVLILAIYLDTRQKGGEK